MASDIISKLINKESINYTLNFVKELSLIIMTLCLVSTILLHCLSFIVAWCWAGTGLAAAAPLSLFLLQLPQLLFILYGGRVCVCACERERMSVGVFMCVCVCVCIGGGGDDHTIIGSEVTDWFRLSTPHHDEKGSWGCEYPSSLLVLTLHDRPILLCYTCVYINCYP